jgi:hypothetical protein
MATRDCGEAIARSTRRSQAQHTPVRSADAYNRLEASSPTRSSTPIR